MAEEYPFTITTYTSSKYFAGTDSNVSVILYGCNGESGVLLLKYGNNKNPFESGKADTFSVKTKDLGMIYKVKVFHDNSGQNPGWYLNKVEVKDGKTQKTYEFPCYRWLAKESNFSTEAILTTGGIPIVRIDDKQDKNHEDHHTDKYKASGLFVRRGQRFYLDIHLARACDAQKDIFNLVLSSGKRPREYNKTLINIPRLTEADDTEKTWGFRILKDNGRVIELEVVCPADALAGKHELTVEAEDREVYKHDKPVYVLFNPWCLHDEVYMKDEKKCNEYVSREHGYIYVGNSRYQSARSWFFGQFDEVTVNCVFELLDDILPTKRNNAITLSRKVSALVNSNDDRGILIGNWSGKYDDGKSPTFWTSSPPIFESYMKTSSVKYGQCWVFSALVTSVMRCLGIPCRCVTNFNSAHDTEKNASHDVYLDDEGEELERMTGDSIWNFHCWNDAWMERPDLPPGYGGWQAIDATPQERSRGLFQMGPTSLRAVKEGEVDFKFDTRFVLAEVNSDVIMWQKNKETRQWEAIDQRRTHIGKKMSTKQVNARSRQDITADYKFEEGSILERAAVKRALKKSGNPAVRSMPHDVTMTLDLAESINIGEDIIVKITTKNTVGLSRKVKIVVGGQVLRYNGVAREKLTHIKKTVDLGSYSEEKTDFRFSARNYMKHLNEHSSLRVFATFQVQETGQVGTADDIVEINKPSLAFEGLPNQIQNGQELKGYVLIKNPLDEALTNCELNLDGSLWKERITLQTYIIKAGETHKFPISFAVQGRFGSRSLLASFTSTQISGIYGITKVRVTKK